MLWYVTVSHCSAGTLRCFQSASGIQREQPGTLFQSLLYKHHESIYTLRCLRTFSLRCTHIYRQTHTHGVALWWDIILSFSMLCYKMYLPCQSVSSYPSSVLVWCFPQGYTHRCGATHPGRWKEHGCHVINDSKNLSLSFSFVLTCTLAFFFYTSLSLSYTHTSFRLTYKDTHQLPAETITQIFSLCATCTKMMTLPWSFCSLPFLPFWNGSNKWNAGCPFPLPYSVEIILTQRYSFCLHDRIFSHY